MKKYIGITIGPVFETMNLSSSPLALWASSYIFSLLSKTLCECLVQDNVNEKNIITPYFKNDEPLLNKNDGIGLFHDRIIFNAENYDFSRLNDIKNNALRIIADKFGISEEYLKKYIMIAAAEFMAENPIMESSKIFDSLELATQFVDEEEINPVLALFSGDEYSKNNELKRTDIVAGFSEFQLKNNNNSFKSLENIVGTGNGYKKFKYYAIVRSDGDNMSKIISDLSNDEEIRSFSETCLKYCSCVAELVKEYNGVTIYSGGDDLLAILPCESKDSLTPLNFVSEANGVFKKFFDKYNKPASLSFGITMAYYKFPLYEALEDSAYLLFDIAKHTAKNCLALRLQKHSGQAEGLVIPNNRLDEIINLFNTVKDNQKSTEDSNKVFLSAIHKISLFEDAFNGTEGSDETYNIFKNVFDGSMHKYSVFLHEKLPEFFIELTKETNIKVIDNNGIIEDNPARTMCYVLRIIKFFFEKGGEEN